MNARVTAWARRLSPLTVRVLSGVLLSALVIGLLAAGRPGLYVIVTVGGALLFWEFRGLSQKWGYQAPSWLLYPLGGYFAFSGTLLRQVPVDLVLALALIVGLSVFLVLHGQREGLGRWAMGVAGALYVGLPFNYYLLLYEGAHRASGFTWVLMLAVTIVISDAAAYLIGHRFGRHPFFPAISPKKTVEGALGGLLCSVPVMLVGGTVLLHLSPLQAGVLGVLIGVAAQLGDLVESQMKRVAGVKDSSNLIPGHGGIMDRMDSGMFAPIVVYFYAHYLGLL